MKNKFALELLRDAMQDNLSKTRLDIHIVVL